MTTAESGMDQEVAPLRSANQPQEPGPSRDATVFAADGSWEEWRECILCEGTGKVQEDTADPFRWTCGQCNGVGRKARRTSPPVDIDALRASLAPYFAEARAKREVGDARNERIAKVLAEFAEADSVSLPVYYRVSPQFIADVRALFGAQEDE